MTDRKILSLIKELKKYDNEEGYSLDYKTVKSRLGTTIKKLVACGEGCIEYLHPLLEHEETWSSLFALEILKEIKSEKSVPYLVDFIKMNENEDYWENCEEAMYALSSIGDAAVEHLLPVVKSDFESRIFFTFLVGALTRIKNERVYSFMVEIVEDYLKNYEKYKGWFNIKSFTYEFEAQGKKDILPLLHRLLKEGNLSESDRREIIDTIKVIEDPEKFKKEIEEIGSRFLEPVVKHAKKKIGRNEPCPCGSGKKYKKCCLPKLEGHE